MNEREKAELSTPNTTTPVSQLTYGTVLGVLALVVLVLVFRKPHAFFNPQFFVEDGTVFFLDAYELGEASLFKPYNGYLHLVPRLVALGSSYFILEVQPILFSYACLLIVLGLTAYILRSRVDLLRKELYPLALVLIPIGAFVYLHLTNIQWFTCVFLVLIIIQHRPRTWLQGGLDLVIVVLAGLTGPFAIPLLYKSRAFNLPVKIVLTLVVIAIAVFAVWFTLHQLGKIVAPLKELWQEVDLWELWQESGAMR